MDEQAVDFHRRVRDAYLAMAAKEPKRFRVIDGRGSVESVAEAVWNAFAPDWRSCVFENFYGNRAAAGSARADDRRGARISQTILLAGPEGVGKATLARRFAARLLGGGDRIEKDDLQPPAQPGGHRRPGEVARR